MRKDFLESSRWLVYQATHRYMPLWKLDSVEEFKTCFIDILILVHFRAYDTAKVVHRDISENNAMARRKVVDGLIVGLLNDWDLAAILKGTGADADTAGHRTGTGPFMAIRLQETAGQSNSPSQGYHHDLESLFWLLVWATLHFDLENKCRLPTRLQAWEGEWGAAADAKYKFLCRSTAFYTVLNRALPSYKGLVATWIAPLAQLFKSAYLAAEVSTYNAAGEGQGFFDDSIYAQKITFGAFMRAIGVTPRK
ncbi:hypothetical protein HDZ31DRAFT_36730 [Schizophyllum fasciatum]